MHAVLASGVSLSSSAGNGILILIAFLAFFAAAIVAWFVEPRAVWGTLVAAGLALCMLALLFGG